MARPSESEDPPLVAKSLKFPPSLWRKLEELIPEGERSAFVSDAVARGLAERETPAGGTEAANREARIQQARGSLSRTGESVENFLRGKQDETHLEERRLPPQEIIRALDQLAEYNRRLPVLPPEAYERERLYGDR